MHPSAVIHLSSTMSIARATTVISVHDTAGSEIEAMPEET
jgi:hypothetical protein